MSVCVYSPIVCRILFMPATLLDVCVLLQTTLLQCYYREIVNIQARLRDVQDPGDDDLGPPVSLLEQFFFLEFEGFHSKDFVLQRCGKKLILDFSPLRWFFGAGLFPL